MRIRDLTLQKDQTSLTSNHWLGGDADGTDKSFKARLGAVLSWMAANITITIARVSGLQAALDALAVGTPEAIGTTLGWRPMLGITALEGGGAATLDGQVTAANAIPAGTLVLLPNVPVGVARCWILDDSTAATDVTDGFGTLRALDYATTTNERVWRSVF